MNTFAINDKLSKQVIKLALLTTCLFTAMYTLAQENFKVTLAPPTNGHISVSPALPEDGMVAAGTVLTVKATPDAGFVLDSGYYSAPGIFGTMYYESPTETFEVVIDQDKTISASFIEQEALDGFQVIQDIVYAQPGVKPLKYDVYTPDGADNLPLIVIVHGGGWRANDEGIMRGMARLFAQTGDYVVASIDYRWIGQEDGDAEPNSMVDLIEDVYGAILHIQEHAEQYGADPGRIAVTGDSAGGHLSASAANMTNMIGDGGFGEQAGVFEYRPSYIPEGKTLAQVSAELGSAIQVAAPSYGVFSPERIGPANSRSGGGSFSQAGIEAFSPLTHIPLASEREVPQLMILGTEDALISHEEVQAYTDALVDAGQRAVYTQVGGAEHAFFDWKPDAQTQATFYKYGVLHLNEMKLFFDSVLYAD